MRLVKEPTYIDSVAMVADITGDNIDLDQIVGYSIQCVWTGTPAGNLILQGSNDAVTWFDIETQAAGGAPGSKLFQKVDPTYRWTRVFWDVSGSTGVLVANYFAKGF